MSNPFDFTGPPYPPPPAAGSNIPGTTFVIGVSPLGLINPFDYYTVTISQYANSPSIDTLLDAMNAWIDQTNNIQTLHDNILNILTAIGYGLDVWGRRVGINRVLKVNMGVWFGFSEANPGSASFGQAAFWNGQPLTSNFALADLTYRRLILAKAMANITDGAIISINRILKFLFPHRGNCYVTEGAPIPHWFGFSEALPGSVGFGQEAFYNGSLIPRMVMTYTFGFPITQVELAIVQNSGVFPKPTGVSATTVLQQGVSN